ncbi:hypothetical protein ILP92_02525 [Maribius pontilimi]|uniref:Uncharacterized protein n=1 Tax=Palleronia pontilimi TaxID=1964209 RepID=A0A934MBL3_9RHOB|nr:hypothetical protein [Palleronia pontilimi]MBJ3761625.1 hypothetical protein [Palleronia pontilimi]
MDPTWIISLLALITILAVLVFAIVSKERTEAERKADTKSSALAKDGDSHDAKT